MCSIVRRLKDAPRLYATTMEASETVLWCMNVMTALSSLITAAFVYATNRSMRQELRRLEGRCQGPAATS